MNLTDGLSEHLQDLTPPPADLDRVVDEAAERRRIFDASAPAERAHDFAMLGAAVVIDLDRVEGWAGVGPNGQIDPICLVRA